MPTRIVKATGPDPNHIGHSGEPAEQWRAALRAKAAAHGISAVGGHNVEARLAFAGTRRIEAYAVPVAR